MGRQNIQWKGIRHSPSDITGQDGDLLECVNLIHENGEMRTIEMPEKTSLKGVWSNETLVAIHNLTDGKRFVFAVWNEVNTFIHIKDESGNLQTINGSNVWQIQGEEIQWADTIGNTLIIGTDKSTHYALYKNGAYKWLGDKLPQPVFQFDMTLLGYTGEQYINIYDPNPPCYYSDGTDEYAVAGGGIPLNIDTSTSSVYLDLAHNTANNRKIIRDNLVAKMAKVHATAKREGRFLYPFFARYALRLFDESHAMHSAPILLLPSTLYCPVAAFMELNDSSNALDDYFNYYAYLVFQCYAKALRLKFVGFVDEDGESADISDWDDIVKGVDLYLSSEIVTFNERYYDNIDNIPVRWYWREYSSQAYDFDNFPDYGNAYAEDELESWLQDYKDIGVFPTTSGAENVCFPLESYSSSEIMEKVANTNLFYKIKSYSISQLDTDDWDDYRYLHNEIEYGALEGLETQPILEDDYVSRCRMVGSANYNYNQRLLLGNISLQAPLWYQDAKTFEDNYDIDIWFEIEKPEKTILVHWDWADVGYKDFGHYIYYPDPDCKKMIVYVQAASYAMAEIPMYEHKGLNGAYALMPSLQSLYEAFQDGAFSTYASATPTASTDDERYYSMPNTIAMSSVANPFYFPATNFKDVGRTKVIGIAANTLDVSSGQWGQFPVYVFCSDGIVAININDQGNFGYTRAVSADVLLEPKGLSQPTLVQLGQALMFLTQRGVMMIAGTKLNCVSEAMDGRHFNAVSELDDVAYGVGAFQNLITRTSDNVSFRDFVNSGFLAYDYAHNRVLLLRSDMDYQYVYSLKTGLWGKQIIYTNSASVQTTIDDTRSLHTLAVKPITSAVNNYTEMYLQDTMGFLYKSMNVMEQNNGKQTYQYGYLVSRPIRFGTDEYKTITRMLNRYTHYANNSFVRVALYGSRDGVSYGRINTLRGMSYQYFIFAIYIYMKPNERYSYLSVDFETRLTNKLR